MKQQIILIHGGESFESHAAWIKSLKAEKVTKESFLYSDEKRWKDRLAQKLGPKYEVFYPEMPSSMNAKYDEWVIWFEKMLPFLRQGPIYIGHSLGAIFLAKYFAEHEDRKKMKALMLVAAPFGDTGKETAASFALPKDLRRLSVLGDKVHLYASTDDEVIPFSHAQKYWKALPQASFDIFTDRGHFRLNEFPEIVEDIQETARRK